MTGDTRHAYEQVRCIYFPIAIGVFALVLLVLLVLLVRGARRRSPAAGPSDAPRFESAYALLLACTAAALVWITFAAEGPIDRTSASPALRIRVLAGQWSWRLQYPNGAVVEAVSTWHPPVAEVPTGELVEFDGTSRDVIHGFWVPQLDFQRQLLPGYVTRFDLRFDRPGRYGGECSVFCGDEHSEMHFAIQAVPPAAFQAWLARQGAGTSAGAGVGTGA